MDVDDIRFKSSRPHADPRDNGCESASPVT